MIAHVWAFIFSCFFLALVLSPTASAFQSEDQGDSSGRVQVEDVYASFRAAARQAIEQKDTIAAEKLLIEMPDVDLMLAVDDSDKLLVELVLLGDPDRLRHREWVNNTSSYFRLSAERGNTEMIRTLLKYQVPLPDYYNGLDWAAAHGQAKVVQAFIDGGANLNGWHDDWGGTALHKAILREHDQIVDMLIEAGADVNVAADYGWCPLHAAAQVGRSDYAEKLLAKGAQLEAVMKWGTTPLHQAILHHQPEMARWLVEHGAKLDVHAAAGLGDLKTVRKLYPDPLKTEYNNARYPTPIFMAAYGNQLEVARHFIEAGLDVEIADRYGISLLTHAAAGESPDVVKYLLENKANPYGGPREGIRSSYSSR